MMLTLLFLARSEPTFTAEDKREIFNEFIDYVHDDDVTTDFAHDPGYIHYIKTLINEDPGEFADLLSDDAPVLGRSNDMEFEEVHGEAGLDGGYSQHDGWHAGGHIGIKWAEEQDDPSVPVALKHHHHRKWKHILRKVLDTVVDYLIWKRQQKEQPVALRRSITSIDEPDMEVEALNFALPQWIITAIKYVIQQIVTDIINRYEVKIHWIQDYKGKYQACVVSLVTKDSISRSAGGSKGSFQTFVIHVKATVQKYVKNIPIKVETTIYEGAPSVVIYWCKE